MSATANLSVTVSIINYKTAHLLPTCVAHLEKHIPRIAHITIVNHSTETIVIRTITPHTIITKTNAGFGAGHNAAFAHQRRTAQERNHIHLFLNPDTYFTENAAQILTHFEDHRVAVVGPRLTDTDGLVDPYCAGREPTVLRTIGHKIKQPHLPHLPQAVDWVSGAALFIRADDFSTIGGFDERYFLYFEDTDLCARLRKRGKRIIFDPRVRVVHIGGQSFSDRTSQKEYYDTSQDLYFRTHHSLFQAHIQKRLRTWWRKRH